MKVVKGIFTVILSVFQLVFLTLTALWTMLLFTRVSFRVPDVMGISGDMLTELAGTPWLMLLSISLAMIFLILIAIVNLSQERRTVLSLAVCMIISGVASLLMLLLSIELRLVLLGCVGCILAGLIMLLIYVISGMVGNR